MNLANSPNFSENVCASDINTNLEFVKYANKIAAAIEMTFATFKFKFVVILST